MSKKYDIAVKTGEYQDRSGKTKARWKNIGSVLDKGDGPFILLDPTFSPAGVERESGRDMLLCSLFKPRDDQAQQQSRRDPGSDDEPNDELPPF